jgi:hypothetical protein
MHDLVVATHGRALWTIDITALEGMTDGLPKTNTLLGASPGIRMPVITGDAMSGDQFYKSRNTQPMARIYYYLTDDIKDDSTVSLSVTGPGMAELNIAGGADMKLKKGLNRYDWNPRIDSLMAAAGTYQVKLKIGSQTLNGTVDVLEPKSFLDK